MEEAKRIVELYTPKAYAIAIRLTGNRQAAWDLVQNAMIRVMRSYGTYNAKYKIEQWLYGILRNLYIDRLRMEARRKETSLDASVREDWPAPADRLVDRGPTPEQMLDHKDRGEAVHRALARLPVEMRMALALVDMEGCSYEEAAKVCGIPASTLGVRLLRGRRAIKKILSETMEA